MRTTWQEIENPSWDVGRRQDLGIALLFGSSSQRCLGRRYKSQVRNRCIHLDTTSCLSAAGPRLSPHCPGVSLCSSHPPQPLVCCLSQHFFIPLHLSVGTGTGWDVGNPLPISWPWWLWVSHPELKPTPQCSPTLFLAGLVQQLPVYQEVWTAQDGCSQEESGIPGLSVKTRPLVQLGPLLHLGSSKPPCKKGNSNNNFKLQYLLLVFL